MEEFSKEGYGGKGIGEADLKSTAKPKPKRKKIKVEQANIN